MASHVFQLSSLTLLIQASIIQTIDYFLGLVLKSLVLSFEMSCYFHCSKSSVLAVHPRMLFMKSLRHPAIIIIDVRSSVS